MNENERYYRSTVGAIGAAMLVFLLFINVLGVILVFAEATLSSLLTPTVYHVVYQILYAAGYLLSFMLPVPILKGLIHKKGYPYQPMQSSCKMPLWTFLLLPAGVAVIFSAASLNASMVSIFHYSDVSSQVLWGTADQAPELYQIVLQFIVTCVVPGFCEEFLFRGAILTNCRPFGRSNAILISALLFSLMHQNAEQIFYAFIAGIFLGLVYEKTGSIWPGTVLHIFNNFVSVSEGLVVYKWESMFESQIVLTLVEFFIFAIGIAMLAVLVGKLSKKTSFRSGFFCKELPMNDGHADFYVSPNRACKLFFTPAMVVFLCLCIFQICALIFLFTVMGYVFF